MFDDIAEFSDLPKYDEYDDDYDLDSLEQPVACCPLGNDSVQQSNEDNQLAYSSYDNEEHEESSDFFIPIVEGEFSQCYEATIF
jgi:hypothetical protein